MATGGTAYTPIGTFIVDDEDDLRLLVRLAVEAHNQGLFVEGEASSGTDAIERLLSVDPNVIVLDQMMPGMDGLETASRILDARPDQCIVLFSAYLDGQLEADAEAAGITRCWPKARVSELPALLLELASS